jgi:arylsulfatase A-like enzyme
VVFTSDNGPVWYSEDVKRLGHDSAGGLRGMKADAWEGGHRMPFVVRWPGQVKPGSVTREIVCFTDLLATFADVVGVSLPPDAGPDSFSFLPVLRGTQPADRPVRESLVISTGFKIIRQGPWKLITGLGSGGFSKPARIQPGPGEPIGQLYHLDDDPGETKNLYAEQPAIVTRLRAELARIETSGRSRR